MTTTKTNRTVDYAAVVATDEFAKLYYAAYSFMYSHEWSHMNRSSYDMFIDLTSDFIKAYPEAMRAFCNKIQDVIMSDREYAAFSYALMITA